MSECAGGSGRQQSIVHPHDGYHCEDGAANHRRSRPIAASHLDLDYEPAKLIAVREHVISQPEDLNHFYEIHPLHKLYGGENAHLLRKYQDDIIGVGFKSLHTIAPFSSPINFAPYTLKSLQEKIAREITKKFPRCFKVATLIFAIFWPVIKLMLNKIDRRPGRLYSFVALKE